MTALDANPSNAESEGSTLNAQVGVISHRARRYNPQSRDEQQVFRMHKAFRATGGLLPLHQVLTLFRRHGGPDANALGDWIRDRKAIAFEWDDETWLPMFQFSRKTLTVHHSLAPVLRELSAIHDGWETANWFALPNSWLTELLPVDMLVRDLPAVWYAAQVERFIAVGDTAGDGPADRERVDWQSGIAAAADLV